MHNKSNAGPNSPLCILPLTYTGLPLLIISCRAHSQQEHPCRGSKPSGILPRAVFNASKLSEMCPVQAHPASTNKGMLPDSLLLPPGRWPRGWGHCGG